ncbi:hypothetical protein TEA_010632 [Camellia sinensis var. sinensis]|uniref:NB-ARC domain-containing protein n=1 Tax=Camellia sinensis var. sinensis TaxID=542762 RepID=A0A4S4D9L2_CAMSN|nr:hypothetical protein TEA_010632 [Camellia sinensis var. sinensis]
MDSMETMFDEGHTNKLINTCLLESLANICKEVFKSTHDLDKLMTNSWLVSLIDENQGKYARMLDLIWNMALKITSAGPRFMVRAGEGLEGVPHEDWSEVLDRVSLVHNNIDELPSGPPICTQLTTLLLIMNDSEVLRIPNSFFTHVQCLKNCRQLSYVPSPEKLKALKELKLIESQIEEVPQGIEELTSLRNLNLSRNYSLFHEAQFYNVQELTNYVKSLQCQSLENYSLVVGIVDKKDQDDEQEKYYPEASEVCIYNSKYFRSIGVGGFLKISGALIEEVWLEIPKTLSVISRPKISKLGAILKQSANHNWIPDPASCKLGRIYEEVSAAMTQDTTTLDEVMGIMSECKELWQSLAPPALEDICGREKWWESLE